MTDLGRLLEGLALYGEEAIRALPTAEETEAALRELVRQLVEADAEALRTLQAEPVGVEPVDPDYLARMLAEGEKAQADSLRNLGAG